MHPEFWHARWREGQIGFHQGTVNEGLTAWWPTLDLPEGSRVLVPLCGKSHDMLWLREQGHEVVGVELSGVACEAFFADNDLPAPLRGPFGPFQAWRGDGLLLLQGDIFDLPPDMTAAAIYDRAATIALPPRMRAPYAERLATVLAPGAPMLLSTLAYPQTERDGPPFSVDPDEVARLYADAFEIEHLAASGRDAFADQAAAWGISWMEGHVFRLTRRGPRG